MPVIIIITTIIIIIIIICANVSLIVFYQHFLRNLEATLFLTKCWENLFSWR